MLDGEVVVFDARGISDFGLLQQAIAAKQTGVVSYALFDLLYLDGHDLREQPLIARKGLLDTLLGGVPSGRPLRYAEHVAGSPGEFYHAACVHELEGVVSKRADRSWVPGRTRDWLKVKCAMRQEFVVGGYTEPEGSREGFGALLLGVYESGALRYAGRTGTGFTEHDLTELRSRLDALASDSPPFAIPPRLPGHAVHWVRPELVVEVAFREWTRDGLVRQASYRGLRADKPAAEVVRETPAAAEREAPTSRARVPSRTRAFGADAVFAGVTLTNPDKPLFEDSSLTKLGLARYYERVAEHMLPHLAGRPLSIVRCPIGDGRECFYQKHPDSSTPPGIRTIELAEKVGSDVYLYVEDLAGLISLVQMGVGEIHAWGSTVEHPEQPDRLVLDLDPGPEIGWREVADAGLFVRERLEAHSLPAFAKATGGKGLHVVIPVMPELGFDEARAWARAFAESLAAEDPERFTTKMAKGARPGRIFIDYLRNSHGATAITPYSTRARPGAPVSVPLEWSELEGEHDVRQPTTDEVLERIASRARDPWAGITEAAVRASVLRASVGR